MKSSLAETIVPSNAGSVEEEFDSIVRLNQQRIYRVLLAYVRDPDAADTLTQECFLRAFRKRESFRGESSIETWLIRIALNLARDHFKSRRRAFWRRLVWFGENPGIQAVDRRLTPERQFLEQERVRAVWAAVDHLPAQQKSVFVLRFGEELSLEQIASTLDLELGTVKSHLSRALAVVRRRLQD